MPLEGLNVKVGVRLSKMEKKEEEMREYIHWIQVGWKLKAFKISLMYCQLILSNAFDISSFISILGVLLSLREWISSGVRIMLSRICRPSTYLVCSFEMRFGRRGLIRLAMTLVMSLKITLHEVIGWKSYAVVSFSSLGMRVRNMELNAGRIPRVFCDSSSICHTSTLMKCQQ